MLVCECTCTIGPTVYSQMLNAFMSSVDKQISSSAAQLLGRSAESLDDLKAKFRCAFPPVPFVLFVRLCV